MQIVSLIVIRSALKILKQIMDVKTYLKNISNFKINNNKEKKLKFKKEAGGTAAEV